MNVQQANMILAKALFPDAEIKESRCHSPKIVLFGGWPPDSDYFTIEDQNDMLLVREKFRFDTQEFAINRWRAVGWIKNYPIVGKGKTIPEAEQACAIAIAERLGGG